MSILEDIVKNTTVKLAQKKLVTPLEDIKSELARLNLTKGAFKANLINKDQAIIAEIKKASPSAGVISKEFDPVQKAKDYEVFGAAALSILTEEDFFLGSIQYLKDVKAVTSLPILRKDFMIDEYQIYEAKLIGADCILLIASILSDSQMTEFVNLAENLELDYLIEVHDEEELNRVGHFKNALIGINNRNLKTFEVDLDNSVRLKNQFNGDNIFIAESGIKNQEDMIYLKEKGLNVFLIGESLMKGNFI
jgi:indole-3-glycerol phosphate synthase